MLCRSVQAPLCVLEYRRPPEHPIPAPMEDAVAAYRYLLETLPGVDIILAGDSAGGGIAAAMLCKLRETNLPMPRCSILISPWTDLGIDGLRHATLENEQHDYLPCPQLTMIDTNAEWLVMFIGCQGFLIDTRGNCYLTLRVKTNWISMQCNVKHCLIVKDPRPAMTSMNLHQPGSKTISCQVDLCRKHWKTILLLFL